MTLVPNYTATIQQIETKTRCEKRVARAAYELYRDDLPKALEWAAEFSKHEAHTKSVDDLTTRYLNAKELHQL